MKRKNESKDGSTRQGGEQSQKHDGQGTEYRLTLSKEENQQLPIVAGQRGQLPSQFITETIQRRLRLESIGLTSKEAQLQAAVDGCELLHDSMLQAVALLHVIPERLFDEVNDRDGSSFEMHIVNGIVSNAQDVGELLKERVGKVFDDICRLRDLELKGN